MALEQNLSAALQKCSICGVVLYGGQQVSHPPYARITRSEIEARAINGCFGCTLLLCGVMFIEGRRGDQGLLDEVQIQGWWFGSVLIEELRDRNEDDDLDASAAPGATLRMWRGQAPDQKLVAKSNALELFQPPDKHTIEALPPTLDLPETPNEEAWSRALGWIEECALKHECSSTSNEVVPARLIQLQPGDEVGSGRGLRLIDCGEILPGKYMTLSYCWGPREVHPLKTLRANYESYRQEIPWSKMPDGFRDVMQIARRLDIEYVWIDALCILQDDSSDWEREANKMSSIYAQSFLTVVAASTENSHDSFLGPRSGHAVEFSVMDSEKDVEHSVLVRPQINHEWFYNSPSKGKHGFPWSNRAWCFQERILASRVLYFSSEEMVFECNASRQCECGQLNVRRFTGGYQVKDYWAKLFKLLGSKEERPHPQNTGNPSYEEILWSFITEYSGKSLTFETDKLPAFSGIARRVSDFNGRYYAGVWEKTLLLAPTFSWASVTGHVSARIGINADHTMESEILDIQCICKTSEPFGEVSSGSLTIKGRLVDIRYLRGGGVIQLLSDDMRPWGERDSRSAQIDDYVHEEEYIDKKLHCLQLLTQSPHQYACVRRRLIRGEESERVAIALVLESTAEEGVYHRAGITYEANPKWFEDAKEETVKIV